MIKSKRKKAKFIYPKFLCDRCGLMVAQYKKKVHHKSCDKIPIAIDLHNEYIKGGSLMKMASKYGTGVIQLRKRIMVHTGEKAYWLSRVIKSHNGQCRHCRILRDEVDGSDNKHCGYCISEKRY